MIGIFWLGVLAVAIALWRMSKGSFVAAWTLAGLLFALALVSFWAGDFVDGLVELVTAALPLDSGIQWFRAARRASCPSPE